MTKRLRRQGPVLFTEAHGDPGPFYGERIQRKGNTAWRLFRADRSKLAAYIQKRKQRFELPNDARVCYLGAARGGTVSHVSDLVPEGRVVAVEPSPVELVGLIRLARRRDNVLPVPYDARRSELLRLLAPRPDLLYQDVAQRDQVPIFLEAAAATEAARGLLALKARSVRVQSDPIEVYQEAVRGIERVGHIVDDVTLLGPEQKDHAMLTVRFGHEGRP